MMLIQINSNIFDDLQGHSPIISLFRREFSFRCAITLHCKRLPAISPTVSLYSNVFSSYVLGAGKTTLLNAISGRVKITSGYVTLNGEPLDRKWQRKMAYVTQADAFYPSLTLRETLTVKSHNCMHIICSNVEKSTSGD